MTTTIQRTGDAGQNFAQVIEGEQPHSIAMSMNAKGQAQLDIKLYFATTEEIEQKAGEQVARIVASVAEALAKIGVPLAGK